jgi:anti-anti-sigma factor
MSDAQTEIVIECSDSLDVSQVSEFKEILKHAAGQRLPVVLDGANLERIDGAALQLITAFFIEVRDSGLSVTWKNPSAPLCRAAGVSGLKETMNL